MSRGMVRRPVPTDLRAKHVDYVHFVVEGRQAEPATAEASGSWKRSAHLHQVDPDSREAPRILTSREVGELRAPLDQLIFSAQDELDHLYKLVREAGYTLLFCDNAGVAVEHRGDEADASRFRYWAPGLAASGTRLSKVRTALALASAKNGLSRSIETSTIERGT